MTKTNTKSITLIDPQSTSCQRLFHGRGDRYPDLNHVCIDWYSPVVLITLYDKVSKQWLSQLIHKIKQTVSGCHSIQVQHRYQSSAPVEVVSGEIIDRLVATENNLKYHINLSKNQNHGLFLDMANGREWLGKNSKNKRVLNLFSYTCAFSVCAIEGKADYVLNLDMSKQALSIGRDNHRLNNHDLDKVKYTAVNLFKSWSKLRREKPFDLLVCDPPTFQKGSIDLKRDYKKIVKRIPEFMAKGSQLLLCYNSPDLNQQFILDLVKEHCPDCIFKQRITNPSSFEEKDNEKGLKVMLFSYQPTLYL